MPPAPRFCVGCANSGSESSESCHSSSCRRRRGGSYWGGRVLRGMRISRAAGLGAFPGLGGDPSGLHPRFLGDILATPAAAQRVALGYPHGRMQQGLFGQNLKAEWHQWVLVLALKNVLSKPRGLLPLCSCTRSVFSAPWPGQPPFGTCKGSRARHGRQCC